MCYQYYGYKINLLFCVIVVSDPIYLVCWIRDTRGDRKVRIKLLSFVSLLLFRDEILANNAAIYMLLFHCNYACIIRTRALQLSLWKHRLTLCGAT